MYAAAAACLLLRVNETAKCSVFRHEMFLAKNVIKHKKILLIAHFCHRQ
jgi:hypothetical protein